MANKKKTAHAYELQLRKMIEDRTGTKCPAWIYPQVYTAAQTMAMLDHIQEQLYDSDLTSIETGSMGQSKVVVNPLVPHYDKLQRNLTAQFEALGLNYRTTPSKVTENTKQGGEEHDKLFSLLESVKSN